MDQPTAGTRCPDHLHNDVVVDLERVSLSDGRGNAAVRDLSLRVRRSEVYCLLGGSMAGKTAVLDLVAGLAAPTAGRVRVLGKDAARSATAVRRQTIYVGHGGLCDSLTPIANVVFFLRLAGGRRRASNQAVINALRAVGTPDRFLLSPLGKVPKHVVLNVQLSLALLRPVALLLLDDPTLGLDSRSADAFIESLSVVLAQGTTVLLATSDVFLAGRIADRTGILVDGEKVVERDRTPWMGQTLMELHAEYIGRPSPFIGDGRTSHRSEYRHS